MATPSLFPQFLRSGNLPPSVYPQFLKSGDLLAVGLYTYQSIILEAREMVGDDVDLCYRYPDSLMVSLLNRGLNELQRIRPDAFYDLYDEGVPEITDLTPGVGQTAWTTTFGIEFRFYPPLVDYISGMVHAIEDQYLESGSAQKHLQMFRNVVLSV